MELLIAIELCSTVLLIFLVMERYLRKEKDFLCLQLTDNESSHHELRAVFNNVT